MHLYDAAQAALVKEFQHAFSLKALVNIREGYSTAPMERPSLW